MSGSRSDAIPLQSQSRNEIEDNEEAAKEFKEGPLEEINNPDCCYIGFARKRACVACCTTCTCLVLVILATYTLVMGILLSRFDDNTLDHAKLNPWPQKDEEGYYQVSSIREVATNKILGWGIAWGQINDFTLRMENC